MSCGGEAETFAGKGQFVDPPDAHPQAKRKSRKQHHKKEFLGWGSREIIEFLKSVGRDTGQVISQHDVARIVALYVNDNGLFDSAKKKRVVCDEKLLSLFGKKSFSRNRIYDLLGSHYAENDDLELDEDLQWGLDGNDGSAERQVHLLEGKPKQERRVVERPKSCFAAVVPDNMKLVYLQKSLVCDLMKDLDSFEGKVVGSFVRTKSDPNDFLQKNPFLLGEVTGVKMVSKCAEGDMEILFQVAGLIKDVPLPMLSDDNFAKEECEDLQQRVKEGLLKRPTIAGLEAKARVLHEAITKNWLARKLAKLDNLIDRANEKGWRKELAEYLNRRNLLRSPEEQSRLFTEMPEVIANELELGPTTTTNHDQEVDEETEDPPATISGRTFGMAKFLCSTEAETLFKKPKIKASADCWRPVIADRPKEHIDQSHPKVVSGTDDSSGTHTEVRISQIVENSKHKEGPQLEADKGPEQGNDETITKHPMIDLTCSDENEEVELPKSKNQQTDSNLPSMGWHYLDPQGIIQGPFTLELLQSWSTAGYFHKDFRVWMTGQSPSDAAKLMEILFRRIS